MVSAGLLGALAGFLGALIALGVPLGKYLHDTRQDARQAVRLLTGEDELDGDGVLPRLRGIEVRSAEHRIALREEGIDVPDLDPDGKAVRKQPRVGGSDD